MKQLLLASALAIAAQSRFAARHHGGPSVSRATYELILQATFAEADAALTRACPPRTAPRRARPLHGGLAVVADSDGPRQPRASMRGCNRCRAPPSRPTSRWTEREPRRAEAWFFHAGAYAPLTQWRVLRGERVAAARDGLRIKNALERAVVARPVAARRLLRHRSLPLLRRRRAGRIEDAALAAAPAGRQSRTGPARDAPCAQSRRDCSRGEADYQLHWLYLWYEHDLTARCDLLRGLDAPLSDQSDLPAAHRRGAPRRSPRSRGGARRLAAAARARADRTRRSWRR